MNTDTQNSKMMTPPSDQNLPLIFQASSPQKIPPSQQGQSLTEYLILVGIIAMGSMLLVSKFGEAVKTATGNIINVFTGKSSSSHRDVEEVSPEYMGRTDLWNSIRKRPTSKE